MGRAIAPDPIPFIDLSDEDDEDDPGMDWTMAWKDEVTEVVDPGMAWAMADQKATELAKHSAAAQQRLKGKKKKVMWSPSNSNAPMEVDAKGKGRGKGKAESVEVSDDED